MFRIAVCDDEKIFVERISEIVKAFFKEQKLECQVDEFYSGEEFVKLKEEVGKYDIVFLDMQMDKMNGIETAKYLRKYGEDTFLVFVTAYAEYAATGYQVQATWFVIKDYDKMEADLREALKNILRKIRKDHKVIAYKFSNVGDAEIRVSNLIYIEFSMFSIKENEKNMVFIKNSMTSKKKLILRICCESRKVIW